MYILKNVRDLVWMVIIFISFATDNYNYKFNNLLQ